MNQPPDQAAPEQPSAVSKETRRRAAFRKYWRGVGLIVASIVVASSVVGVVARTLALTSQARARYWPASLTLPWPSADHPDPVVAQLVGRGFCNRSYDPLCQALLSIAKGSYKDFSQAIEDYGRNKRKARDLEDILLAQLRDAAERRDWATCGIASTFLLLLLDKVDFESTYNRPENNQALLLASACEYPDKFFTHSDPFTELVDRIVTGHHLEAQYLDNLMDARDVPQLEAWGRYLSSLAALRHKEFGEAAVGFRLSAQKGTGMVRQLALLGLARAEYWQFATASASNKEREVMIPLTRGLLNRVASETTRRSFRSDINHYIQQVGS